MKFLHLSIFVITLLLITEGLADSDTKPLRKHKKFRKHRKPLPDEVDNSENQSKFIEDNPIRTIGLEPVRSEVETPPEESEDEFNDNRVPLFDPCMKVHCGAGRVCQADKEGEPQCVCIPTCPVETESRRKVCTNYNETWTSDCSVYQQRCFCEIGDAQCKGDKFRHVHIEYYGECREARECTKDEMADFPRRMRDWLFNIMRDLADRAELNTHFLKMEKEAESNMTRRWTNAAIWKFCDLDGNPPDRSVSRHELFPIRAPLMALEHCIAPFLNGCDANDDHKINIKEWAKCLELEEDEIEDRCEEIAEEEEDNLV